MADRPLKDQILKTLKIVDQWQRGVSPLIQPLATDLTILRYLGFLEPDSNQLTPEGRAVAAPNLTKPTRLFVAAALAPY